MTYEQLSESLEYKFIFNESTNQALLTKNKSEFNKRKKLLTQIFLKNPELKQAYNNSTNEIKTYLNKFKKNEVSNENNKKLITTLGIIINNFKLASQNTISNIAEEFSQKFSLDIDKENIKKAFILMVYKDSLLGIMLKSIVKTLFGVNRILGELIYSGVVAPINEETSKLIAVKYKFIKEYQIVFNTFEFTSYVFNMKKQGIKLAKAIAIRTPALCMHILNSIILNLGFRRKEEKGKDGKKPIINENILIILTSIIHIVFNTTQILFNFKQKGFTTLNSILKFNINDRSTMPKGTIFLDF